MYTFRVNSRQLTVSLDELKIESLASLLPISRDQYIIYIYIYIINIVFNITFIMYT